MSVPYIIIYLSNVIWLPIPFRQLRTDFFSFFLFYAILSALSLFDIVFLIHPAYIYFGFGFFLIISLYNFKKTSRYIFFLSSILAISVVLPFFISVETITLILILQHSIIFFIILKRTIIYSINQGKLNLFHFILLLFEISVVMRFFVVVGNLKTGIIFFYLTAAFSILIGIFFLFYNVKNSPEFSMAHKDIS